MRKWGVVLLALAVALAVGLFISKTKTAPPSASPEEIAAQDAAVARALAKQNPNTVSVIESNFARVRPAPESSGSSTVTVPSSGPPAALQFTNFAPAIALENMSRAIRQYGEMFGGNPVGTNPEITSQLSGHNPKHINFIDTQAGMRTSSDGDLIDPWGTPYFFHQISGTEMEIHSAGPDKIMWTSDDLVVK